MAHLADAAPLKALFAAFERRDAAALAQLLADDVVWHVPGHTRISGEHRGRDAVLGFFSNLGALTDGTWRARLVDVLAGEHVVAALAHGSGERGPRRYDADYMLLAKTAGGRLIEVRLLPADPHAFLSFWS